MEPPRKGPKSRDFIKINVGGTIFSTSKTNLRASFSYFESSLSSDWHDDDDDEETLFLDQDPETFKTLLHFMRYPFIKASSITGELLIMAEFLGMDLLLNASKVCAYRYMHGVECRGKTINEICLAFDHKYGGMISVVRRGILPDNIKPSTDYYEKEYASLIVSTLVAVAHYDVDPAVDPAHDQISYVGQPMSTTVLLSSHFKGSNHMSFLDAMNLLHEHGFTVREDNSQHHLDPFRPPNQLFSRPANVKQNEWECPILFDKSTKIPDRRQFAAWVTLKSALSSNSLENIYHVGSRDFVMAEGRGTRLFAKEMGERIEDVGNSRISCVLKEPLQWLQNNGYTRDESDLGEILKTKLVDGYLSYEFGTRGKPKIWQDECIVSVFSRPFVGPVTSEVA